MHNLSIRNDCKVNRGPGRTTVGIRDDIRELIGVKLVFSQGLNHGRIGRVHNGPGFGIDGDGSILQWIHSLVVQSRADVRALNAIGPRGSDRYDRQRLIIGITVVVHDLGSDEATVGIELINRPEVVVVLGDRKIVLSNDIDADIC